MADIRQRIVIESVDNTTRGMRTAQNKLNAFDRTLKRVQTTMMGFVGINIATHMIQGLTRLSDSAVELDAKLKLMTDSTEDFNYAQSELVKLSLESGSSFEANTILFTRMNKAIKLMGGNTQTTLDTTRALSHGLRISGASTQESASVIRQYSQAMASGVLRGEEFNAVSENGGRIIQALSASLGVSIGELRAMSKEGQLTAQVVTEALLKQSDVLAKENAKLPLTIGRAIENIRTNWTLLMQDMSEANAGVADIINTLANNFDELAKAMGIALKVAIAYGAVQFVKHMKEQLVALKLNIIAQKESAEATRLEEIVKQKLIVTEAKSSLLRKEQALAEAKNAVLKNKQYIINANFLIKQNAMIEQQILLEIKREELILRAVHTSKARLLALANLTKMDIALNNVRKDGVRVAEMLTVANNGLTQSLVAQTGVISRNALAQKVANTGALGVMGKLKGAMGIVSMWAGRIGSALLGLPGIIAYVGYEIGKHFFDWGMMIEMLVAKMKQGLLRIAEVNWLTNPFGLMTNKYREWSDDIETTLEKSFVDHLEYLKAVKAGFDNIADYKKHLVTQEIQAEQERINQINKLQLEREELVNNTYKISEEKLKEHIGLMNEIAGSNEEAFQAKLEKIKFEAEIENQTKQEMFDAIAELTEAHYVNQAEQYTTFYDEQLALVESGTKEHLQLEREKYTKLKELNDNRINETRESIKTLIEIEKEGVESAITAVEEIKNLEQRKVDFLRKLNGDMRTDWQKNLEAQKKRYDFSKDLRQADILDQQGKHAEAKKIRDKALDGLEKLITSEKTRQKGLEKGSLDELRLRATVTNAVNLYKESIDKAVKSQKDAVAGGNQVAEDARKKVDTLTEGLAIFEAVAESVQTEIQGINDQIAELDDIELEINSDEISSKIDGIDAEIKALSQTVTVTVKTVKTGGTKDVEGKQSGGMIRRAIGGFIPRSNKVPGTGTGDKVKALLEPGEFIMRKSAVQKIGESAMYAMNRGEQPVRRKEGGMIQRFINGGRVSDRIEQLDSTSKTFLLDMMRLYQKGYTAFRSKTKDVYGGVGGVNAKGMINARASARITKGIMDTIGQMKGKKPEVQEEISKINHKIFEILVKHPKGFRAGEDNLIPQLMRQRSSWLKFAEGGSVPGSGLGDTVRALLTPGEYVMKKGVVQQFGSDFMNSI